MMPRTTRAKQRSSVRVGLGGYIIVLFVVVVFEVAAKTMSGPYFVFRLILSCVLSTTTPIVNLFLGDSSFGAYIRTTLYRIYTLRLFVSYIKAFTCILKILLRVSANDFLGQSVWNTVLADTLVG